MRLALNSQKALRLERRFWRSRPVQPRQTGQQKAADLSGADAGKMNPESTSGATKTLFSVLLHCLGEKTVLLPWKTPCYPEARKRLNLLTGLQKIVNVSGG